MNRIEWSLSRTDGPDAEPIVLADAKSHLCVTDTASNTLITALIVAAREYVENATHRQLITATWLFCMDRYPTGDGRFELPRPPLSAVNSISWTDTDGNTQDLDDGSGEGAVCDWAVTTAREPAIVMPKYGTSWPGQPSLMPECVQVEFESGYGASGDDVPAALRQAMLLMIGHWFVNRESTIGGSLIEIPLGAKRLIEPYRVHWTEPK